MVQIEIVQGTGRGKTTNAMGKVAKFLCENKKIMIVQFLKTGKNCGECEFFKENKNIIWFSIGKKEFFNPQRNREEFKEFIEKKLENVINKVKQEKLDILVLDELGIVLYYGLITMENVYPLIRQTTERVIITGRLIPEEIKKRFPSVQIKEIKHPFHKGILARKGIDY